MLNEIELNSCNFFFFLAFQGPNGNSISGPCDSPTVSKLDYKKCFIETHFFLHMLHLVNCVFNLVE